MIVGSAQTTATLDTKLVEMGGNLVSNPLERNMRFHDFGRHATAPGNAALAFEKLNGLWDEEIQENDSGKESSEESESDSHTTNETTANEMEIEKENAATQTTETQNTNKDGTTQKHTDQKRLKQTQNDKKNAPTPEKRSKHMESDRASDWHQWMN
jgi:hypothetical protein